jgi:hypothetical protein
MSKNSVRLFVTQVFGVALVAGGCASGRGRVGGWPVLTGEYLGQTPPGASAALFAPGIVSTGMNTRDLAMTPDGREIYYSVTVGPCAVIMETKLRNGRWTPPEVAPFSANPNYMQMEPHIAPDGRRFYFLSNRPRDGSALPAEQVGTWVNQDIWVMDRVADGWGEPYHLGSPVDSEDEEYFPSVTRDGTMYFTRTPRGTRESYIYRASFVNGAYREPERLPRQVNSTASQFNAFVAPDESYLILSTGGRQDGRGGADYYIVFRRDDDAWSEPLNMGAEINTPQSGEWSPYVSPDGRYVFFMATRRIAPADLPERLTRAFLERLHDAPRNGSSGIYWIDASVISRLRAQASFGAP